MTTIGTLLGEIKSNWTIIVPCVAAVWIAWSFFRREKDAKREKKLEVYINLSDNLTQISNNLKNFNFKLDLKPLNDNLREIEIATGIIDAVNKTETPKKFNELVKKLKNTVKKGSENDGFELLPKIETLKIDIDSMKDVLINQQALQNVATQRLTISLQKKEILWKDFHLKVIAFFDEITEHFNSLDTLGGLRVLVDKNIEILVEKVKCLLVEVKLNINSNRENPDFAYQLRSCGVFDKITEIDSTINQIISAIKKKL